MILFSLIVLFTLLFSGMALFMSELFILGLIFLPLLALVGHLVLSRSCARPDCSGHYRVESDGLARCDLCTRSTAEANYEGGLRVYTPGRLWDS